MHAVLSWALADAVKRRRLTHNVAQHVGLPPLHTAERVPWTAAQAVAFLDYAHRADDPLIGARALFIHPTRGTLPDVGGRLMFTAPKTKGSAAGVGLSARVVAASERQRSRQAGGHAEWAEDHDLVFARVNGTPVRPDWVLDRFHELTEQAGLLRVRLHDLRHLAATLMLTAGVPLALVSKVLRHATSGITVDRYGHLTAEAALAAADSLGTVLDAAAAELAAERAARAAAARP